MPGIKVKRAAAIDPLSSWGDPLNQNVFYSSSTTNLPSTSYSGNTLLLK